MISYDPILNATPSEAVPCVLTAVLVLLTWIAAYFVYLHAKVSDRTVWFWTLVVCIPVIGITAYIIYSTYMSRRSEAAHRQAMREQKGEYMLKPKTIGKVLKDDAERTLRSFRDEEVEGLILERKYDDARIKISGRQVAAASRNDSVALETYYLYIQLLERYSPEDDPDPELVELLTGEKIEPSKKILAWDVSDYDELTGHYDQGGYLTGEQAEDEAGEPEETQPNAFEIIEEPRPFLADTTGSESGEEPKEKPAKKDDDTGEKEYIRKLEI